MWKLSHTCACMSVVSLSHFSLTLKPVFFFGWQKCFSVNSNSMPYEIIYCFSNYLTLPSSLLLLLANFPRVESIKYFFYLEQPHYECICFYLIIRIICTCPCLFLHCSSEFHKKGHALHRHTRTQKSPIKLQTDQSDKIIIFTSQILVQLSFQSIWWISTSCQQVSRLINRFSLGK